MQPFENPQSGTVEAFIAQLENYYARPYPTAQRTALLDYLGDSSRSYRQALYKTIIERFGIQEAAMSVTKLPDLHFMRLISDEVCERQDLMIADKARLDRLALPDTDDVLDVATMAEEAGVDTAREGWMISYLFQLQKKAHQAD